VNPAARIDLLLPVVREVVDEAADDGVRLQARRWQRVVEDLRGGWLLQQQLAALARPLATDLALHEELRRHDVQPLADVFAHALHRLATFGRRATRFLGLDARVHARRCSGSARAWLTTLLVLGWGIAWASVRGAGPQGSKLLLEARLVGGEGLFEDIALLGGHAFGLGTELQAFSLASWNVMLSILASRHLMACACEPIRLACASM